MTLLFKLRCTSTRPPRGFVSGPVPAVPAAYAGIHVGYDVFKPDPAAVRECLPHQWRKALDRTDVQFWYPSDPAMPAHLTLRDSRGRNLATIYATPYHA